MTVEAEKVVTRRWWQGRAVRRFVRKPTSVVALVILTILVVVAILAPWLAPHDPDRQVLADRLMSPSGEHLLGTDEFGRDVLSRLLVATRIDLFVSLQAVALSLLVGAPLGVAAGYFGGAAEAVIGRLMDAVMTLPALVLAVVVVGLLGPGLQQAMLAITVVMVPMFYRIARGSTQDVSSEQYVESARASGCTTGRILRRHIVPGILPPLIVQCSFAASVVIVAGSSLSFLGLGARPPQSTWGGMLREASSALSSDPFLIYPPMAMIVVTILALSLLGDGLRDALGRDTEGRQ